MFSISSQGHPSVFRFLLTGTVTVDAIFLIQGLEDNGPKLKPPDHSVAILVV